MADIIRTITIENAPVPPRFLEALESFVVSFTSTPGEVQLGWIDNGAEALQYEIVHALSAGSTTVTETISATPMSGAIHFMTGLNDSIDNYFRIRAKNGTRLSAWTNFFLAGTGVAPAP